MRDWIPEGRMSFLAGDSEMARRIRSFDWSRHPFGRLEEWPQSLRSALSICLHSAFPTAIYWGPELRLLYNDAWATIPGPRHPAALGAPAHEVWADIWNVIEPQFRRLRESGAGIFVEDQMLPMARFGAPEETYWSYSFTAIRGEDGTVAGVFNSGSETTASVRTARQMRFLLDYGQALRSAASPDEGRRLSLSMLGEHLRVDRVGIAGRAEDDDVVKISDEWTAEGVRPIGRDARLADFGDALALLSEGRSVASDDVGRDPRFDPAARAAFAGLDIAAFVAVPWRVQGDRSGVVYLHSRSPRDWSDFDVATVEALLERTRAWIDAERAAEREHLMAREIDHRARNALAVAQSVVRLTRADDMDTFREKAENRIGALARAHALLAARSWKAIDLGTLLGQELDPHRQGAVPISATGPKVALPAEMAQTFALLLHELVTNAAKHGALGNSEGRLDIRWRLEDSGLLVLEWHETPARPKPAQPAHQGFGTVLIARVVEAQLSGSIESDFAEDGLRVTVSIPLPNASGGG